MSRADEMKAQVETCEAFLKDVKAAKNPVEAKKAFDEHRSKLEKTSKASKAARSWLSVPEQTRKAYSECYNSARSELDKHDGKLAIEFGEIHGGS